jgi:hypothetical protein
LATSEGEGLRVKHIRPLIPHAFDHSIEKIFFFRDNGLLCVGDGGLAKAFELPSGKPLYSRKLSPSTTLEHPFFVFSRRLYVIAANPDRVECLELSSGRVLWSHAISGVLLSCGFRRLNGRSCVALATREFVHLLKADKEKEFWRFRPGKHPARFLSYIPAADAVVCASNEGIRLANLFEHHVEKVHWKAGDLPMTAFAVCGTSFFIAAGGDHGKAEMRVWRFGTAQKDYFVHTEAQSAYTAITPLTDETVAVANTDPSNTQFSVSVFDLQDRHQPLRVRFTGVGRDVKSMSADGDVLLVVAAVGHALSLQIFNWRTGQLLQSFEGVTPPFAERGPRFLFARGNDVDAIVLD